MAGFAGASVLALLLALPSGASAQLPSICDQYPDLPVCAIEEPIDRPPGDDPGAIEDPDAIGDPGAPGALEDPGIAAIEDVVGLPAARPGPGARATLPFTGYPLTPLLLLLLLLLLAGVTLRAAAAIQERRAAASGSENADPPLRAG